MQFELSYNGLRAQVESLGGELVSLTDPSGTEYIWCGNSAYWSGRNPVLFPIVGRLRDGVTTFDGIPYEIAQHGFARRQEFAVIDRADDHVVFAGSGRVSYAVKSTVAIADCYGRIHFGRCCEL